MRIFKIKSKNIDFICESKNTRNGFKHKCIMFKNGYEVAGASRFYLNRTWESFEFQSVIKDCIDKYNKDNNSEQISIDELDK